MSDALQWNHEDLASQPIDSFFTVPEGKGWELGLIR